MLEEQTIETQIKLFICHADYDQGSYKQLRRRRNVSRHVIGGSEVSEED